MFTAAKGILEPQGYELITLSGEGQTVRILPQNGFNLYSWMVDGQEIMMTPPDITIFGTKYGTPILFPMPNRVKDSVYRWQGKDYLLTKRGKKIARHGLVCDEPFRVRRIEWDEDSACCVAEIAIREGDGLHEGYPFACTLQVTYTLDKDGVHFAARITNDGGETMPFGLAIHPYFTKRGDASKCFIKVPVSRYYETDEDLIPTGRILPAQGSMAVDDDFHSIESLYLDTVYRGMTADKEALVRYENMIVHIRASDCFRNAVIFTPHNKEGFCIEPQTCATNSINLHAQGLIDESGLLALPAGQTFACRIDMTAEKI